MSTIDFYDRIAPFYHLIFPGGFDAAVQRHAEALHAIIQKHWDQSQSILDVSCGIGTQALGLAQRGYWVTACDLSPKAIERARQEAALRGLDIDFSVVDMRHAHDYHARQFDIVLSADNSVPHLLNDDDILTAFQQFYQCCKPGGGCIITVRDYENEDLTGGRMLPYGMRVEGGVRYFIFQVREYDGPIYEVSMYFVQDSGGPDCITHVMRTKYYAIGAHKLMRLMEHAGFQQVQKIDDVYFQPVLIGYRI